MEKVIVWVGAVITVPIIITILVVKWVNHVTVSEAIDIIFDQLDSVNQKAIAIIEYDVFIGWNGYSFIYYIIEDKFKNFLKYWKIMYVMDVINTNTNYIIYIFKVDDLINPNIGRKHLLHRARSVSEQALTEHFHENGIFIPVDDFVAVIWQGDIVNVIIAKNKAGFEDIKRFRRQSH